MVARGRRRLLLWVIVAIAGLAALGYVGLWLIGEFIIHNYLY